MNRTLEKVQSTIETYAMLRGNDDALVGVSGGADSVCLLLMLTKLTGRVHAVHVNHGLRESAGKDEAYVRDLCARLHVPLTVRYIQAGTYAREHGLGVEEAGHILRRRIFEEEADAISDSCRIALAHHSEDQAETVLFHLCRGSGIRGLAGIRPVDGRLIRPLLYLTRDEIEEYLRLEGISWCTDETNLDPSYARNRIRLSILPELTETINAGTTRHLCEIAEDAAEVEDYLEEETGKALASCRQKNTLLVGKLLSLPSLLEKRVLQEMLTECAGHRKDLTRAHVEALLGLAEKPGNGQLDLPYGVTCRKSYDVLIFERDGEKSREEKLPFLPTCKADYHPEIFPFSGCMADVPRGTCTKWFDYDRIIAFLEYRTRREKDAMTVYADGRRKKLSRILIDLKIPADLRDHLVLPAVRDEILWVPGGPVSLKYPITETTRRVLSLSVSGN